MMNRATDKLRVFEILAIKIKKTLALKLFPGELHFTHTLHRPLITLHPSFE